MLSCSKCLLPETAEATSFDDTGSCSVCAQIEVRDTQINWDERHAQMLELDDGGDCLAAHIRDGVLVAEPIGAP